MGDGIVVVGVGVDMQKSVYGVFFCCLVGKVFGECFCIGVNDIQFLFFLIDVRIVFY